MNIPYGYLSKKFSEGMQVAPVTTLVVSAVGLVGYGIYKLVSK